MCSNLVYTYKDMNTWKCDDLDFIYVWCGVGMMCKSSESDRNSHRRSRVILMHILILILETVCYLYYELN